MQCIVILVVHCYSQDLEWMILVLISTLVSSRDSKRRNRVKRFNGAGRTRTGAFSVCTRESVLWQL